MATSLDFWALLAGPIPGTWGFDLTSMRQHPAGLGPKPVSSIASHRNAPRLDMLHLALPSKKVPRRHRNNGNGLLFGEQRSVWTRRIEKKTAPPHS